MTTPIELRREFLPARVRFHYTLVAIIGRWQSGEGAPGDSADEVA